MKSKLNILFVLFLISSVTSAQDTLYIYHTGRLVLKRSVSDIDSITFAQSEQNIVVDVDGNVYGTVIIGSQTWLSANLRTSKYNDNTPIPMVSEATDWNNLSSGAYCWYNNDPVHEIPYGKLYNWYAVNSQKLCPSGWHVPNESEWLELAGSLGGTTVAGGKLKSTGTLAAGNGLWEDPNSGATNEIGFSALPAGRRYDNGSFEQKGIRSSWWSSQEDFPGYAFFWNTGHNTIVLNGASQSFKNGMTVRCVKDE